MTAFGRSIPSLFVLLLAPACFPSAADYQARQQRSYAAAMGGPTHPATTPAQWAELDGRAAELAHDGTTNVVPAEHLVNRGFDIEKAFDGAEVDFAGAAVEPFIGATDRIVDGLPIASRSRRSHRVAPSPTTNSSSTRLRSATKSNRPRKQPTGAQRIALPERKLA